jgi:hypothetical protein
MTEHPYFLTANHCVGGSVTSWVIRFNFQATTCGGSTSQTYQTAIGTTLLASGAASDYALLRINGGVDIPTTWNPYYAGWDSSTAIPTSSCGIHHPSGDLKKISFENQASEITAYSGGAGSGTNHIRVVDWDSGTTEGGSSGSPLFNQNHRIVGQLHGGGAACGNNLSDWYGRFNTSFPFLCNWLAPGQCALTTLAGYDPLISGVALDAQINQVTSPTGTICGATATPSVIVSNSGTTTLTSFVLTYNVDGGTNQTYNWTGTLTSGNAVTINLATLTLTDGAHTFNVTVGSPNGGTDQNAANNAGSSNYTAITTGSTVTLTLLTDCWGEEVSWNIENSSNTILYSQAANTLGDQVTTVTNFCLANGCYDFNIFDSFGDGLNGTAFGCAINGNYSMTGPSGTLFTMGAADYGTGTTHNFCLNAGGVPGCTNPLACNYNAAATVDDGTCIVPTSNDQCSGAQSLTINGASVSGNNSSTCSDGPLPSCGGTTMLKDVWYSFNYTGGNITITTTLGTLTDTRIAVYSSCGGAEIACNDDINASSNLASSISLTCGQITAGTTYYIQVGGFQALTGTFGISITSSQITGCTNPIATNYNSCATQEDGSCIIPGCTNSLACNFNPTATSDDGSCVFPGCTNPAACNYAATAGCEDGSCVFPGCTNPAACNYSATAGCEDGSCVFPGCTNPAACNYAATAGCDDGSCVFPGCTNPAACNYAATAGCEDGSCIFPGCTNPAACNYAATAGCEDGSCVFPGCTNPAACNYAATAGCDDGSCVYPGCTDSGACNYDAAAGCDDGSCDYSCLTTCPGDFNGDSVVGISDLLSFLGAYGCPSGCAPYDLSGDDLVGAADLLIFLSYYGTTCN